MAQHKTVEREAWLAARRQLLAQEKEFTRQRDALNAARRALPWVRLDKQYTFTEGGQTRALVDLFGPHSQLLVYHFMFGPDWDQGCPSCSFWADSFNGVGEHLAARDVALVAVSRAPFEKLAAYRERLGWRFRWLSSLGDDFNFDFGVSFREGEREGATYNFEQKDSVGEEMPGLSAFIREGDTVYHTYSTYSRGLDLFNTAYNLLDVAPKGRDEDDLPWTMAWLKRRDDY